MAMPLLGVSPFAFYMCINVLRMNVLLGRKMSQIGLIGTNFSGSLLAMIAMLFTLAIIFVSII